MEQLISLASAVEDKHKLQLVYQSLCRDDKLAAISHLCCMTINYNKQYNDIRRYIAVLIIIATIIISKYIIWLLIIPIMFIPSYSNQYVKIINDIIDDLPYAVITDSELNRLKQLVY